MVEVNTFEEERDYLEGAITELSKELNSLQKRLEYVKKAIAEKNGDDKVIFVHKPKPGDPKPMFDAQRDQKISNIHSGY